MKILNMLEPRFHASGDVIYQTVEDVEEMYFIMEGSVNIGFEFNRSIKNAVRLTKGMAIGAYNCTFDKKTIFNYSVHSSLHAFTIRKRNWFYHINDKNFDDLAKPLRKKIEENYMLNIKYPIIRFQTKFLNRQKEKSKKDYLMMSLVDLHTDKVIVREHWN